MADPVPWPVDTGSGEQGPDPAFPDGGAAAAFPGGGPVAASPWMGSAGLSTGFLFFLFSYLINRGGQAIASENGLFTMTLCPRRLPKMPQLSVFARLG